MAKGFAAKASWQAPPACRTGHGKQFRLAGLCAGTHGVRRGEHHLRLVAASRAFAAVR
jgi:hypothetical protein